MSVVFRFELEESGLEFVVRSASAEEAAGTQESVEVVGGVDLSCEGTNWNVTSSDSQ